MLGRIDFIVESNRIEGITRYPSDEEIAEYDRFMALDKVTVHDLEVFVRVYTKRTGPLRSLPGMDVQVGNHVPPNGGPYIEAILHDLLLDIAVGLDAWETHVRFETLHPFMDGNGRAGRMLWAWQMGHAGLGLGFLHKFYYQTLDHTGRK